ncbi:unnamed protein product [Diamesa serratosioi]
MVLLKCCLLLTVSFSLINCFNISPSPNIILKRDSTKTLQNEKRSAYFGYTINLRKNSVIIGAPRSQSVLKLQKNINETGTIYKCDLNGSNINKECYPYTFDFLGNMETIDKEFDSNKEYQMLGGSMDGIGSESSTFIVCAPNLKDTNKIHDMYYTHGICYWVHETNGNITKSVQQVSSSTNKIISHAQMGFSVHVTEHEEFIIGAPGSNLGRGAFLRTPSNVFMYPNGVEIDSYFGYAVSSGYFTGLLNKELYYVASAPRANNVLILNGYSKNQVDLKLSGDQMGEYFGYTLLVEDFNNDGFSDIAVSAPFYSKNMQHEHGAVYIFLNNGIKESNSVKLTSDYELSGRFGTALSKIGDINLDGYNDIAITAPFEGNGVVYIYLGGLYGLSSKPSQIIKAPTSDAKSMFGHSISRGVDIDNNKYNDVAIGAPNSDIVYIYKSYPILQIITSLNSQKKRVLVNETEFTINVCAGYISPGSIIFEIDIKLTITAELRHNTSFTKGGIVTSFVKNTKLNSAPDCFDVIMYYICTTANVYMPIEIGMTYSLIKTELPTNSVFCETCVIEDPNNSKFTSLKIPFTTGCLKDICESDLLLIGSFVNITEPYILGSTTNIAVLYNITNFGEAAYLVELTIKIPSNVKLSKYPSNCNVNKEQTTMKCDVNVGKKLVKDEKLNFTAIFDVSLLSGTVFQVNAFVNSSSQEVKPVNNQHELKLVLEEFTNIELKGDSEPSFVTMIKETSTIKKVQNKYIIRNCGPSNVDEMIVTIFMPTSFITNFNHTIDLVNSSEVFIRDEFSNNIFVYKIDETSERDLISKKETVDYLKMHFGNMLSQSETFVSSNKTIYVNCTHPQDHIKCDEFCFIIKDFSKYQNYVFTIEYSLNMSQFDQIFNSTHTIFLFKLGSHLQRTLDIELKTIKVTENNPFIIIYSVAERRKSSTWIIIWSVILGTLLLALLTFGAYKCGFFKRPLKDARSIVDDETKDVNSYQSLEDL